MAAVIRKWGFLFTLLLSCHVFAAPTNTMNITPAASDGAIIQAADENSRNNEISTKFAAHGHEDITKTTNNSLTIGDGNASDKSVVFDDGSAPLAQIVYDDSEDAIVVTNAALMLQTGTAKISEFSTDGTLADNSDTAVPTEKAVKTYVDTEGFPTGIMLPYGGATAPTGWLLCYGQAVSRATYSELFTAIGTSFGTGDGSTTFNVPDLRGRFPLGKDNMGGSSADRVVDADADTIGNADGAETHTLTVPEIPGHTHTFAVWNNDATLGNKAAYTTGSSTSGTVTTSSVGGSGAHNNMPPYQTFNYIIKY